MAKLRRTLSQSMQSQLHSVVILKEKEKCGFCNLDISTNTPAIVRQMFLADGWVNVHFHPQCTFHVVHGDSRTICSDCGVVPSTNERWKIENWAIIEQSKTLKKQKEYISRFLQTKSAICICKSCLKSFLKKHRNILRCCLGEEQQFDCPVAWLPTAPDVKESDLLSSEDRWGPFRRGGGGLLGSRRQLPDSPAVIESFRMIFRNINNWEAVDDPKKRAAQCEKLACDAHMKLMDQIYSALKEDKLKMIEDY